MTTQAEVSKKLDMFESVRHVCQSVDIPLPGVVVVGEQSAGKSSLLENISGIQFPRAQNTCTRMPCVLSLLTDPTVKESHAMVSIDPGFANDPWAVHRKIGSYFVSIHREKLHFLGQRLVQAMMDILLTLFCMQPRQQHAPCRKLKSRSNS